MLFTVARDNQPVYAHYTYCSSAGKVSLLPWHADDQNQPKGNRSSIWWNLILPPGNHAQHCFIIQLLLEQRKACDINEREKGTYGCSWGSHPKARPDADSGKKKSWLLTKSSIWEALQHRNTPLHTSAWFLMVSLPIEHWAKLWPVIMICFSFSFPDCLMCLLSAQKFQEFSDFNELPKQCALRRCIWVSQQWTLSEIFMIDFP